MTKKRTIEEMQQLALEKGGWCLSPEYINTETKLWWQCGDCEHVWDAKPTNVKNNNSWCPKCAGKLFSLEDLQELALKRGWKLLSTKYINSKTKYKWECDKGHTVFMTSGNMRAGYGCAECYGNIKPTIEKVKRTAEERGFKCLSDEYINNTMKLKFECPNEHIFLMGWMSFRVGQGCPICSSGLYERVCRAYFELVFNKKFPSRWPKWLKNNRGNKMQLDGYCKELNLAFEYHGRQHFMNLDGLYKDFDLKQRTEDDETKKELCKQHDVTLIIIDYKTKLNDMQKKIVKECKEQGIVLPDKIKYIDFRKLNVYSVEKLKEIQDIALERGGWCLSTEYITANTKLWFQCGKGHVWSAVPNNVKNSGNWCKRCAELEKGKKYKKRAYEKFKKIVEKKGGKILSEYINGQTKIHIDCGKGHDWWTNPKNIVKGSWCPICYKINRKQGPKNYNRNYKKFPHKHKF